MAPLIPLCLELSTHNYLSHAENPRCGDTLIIHVVTWQVGRNAMRNVENDAYFKHANFESVKIISVFNEITNLKKKRS